MSDKKDKTYDTANTQKDSDKPEQTNDPLSGYGKSGGNMGAGKSGTENLGTEKSSDDARMGSQKSHPDTDKNQPDSDKNRADNTDARK